MPAHSLARFAFGGPVTVFGYWWAVDSLPLGGIKRHQGLMRPSVTMCVWFGPPDCYRNQDNVLWAPSDTIFAEGKSDMALRTTPSGRTYRDGRIAGLGRSLGSLRVPGGTVQRNAFNECFPELVRDLKLGTFVMPATSSEK